MFKSIFSKLVFIFIGILILSFSITGGMLFYFLDNFVTAEKVRVLERSADEINLLLAEYEEYLSNPLALSLFQSNLRSYMVNTNSYIWIVSREGYIYFTGTAKPELGIRKDVAGRLEDPTGRLRYPDEKQYVKLMTGQITSMKEIGDFYGLFAGTGSEWLTIAKPYVSDNMIGAAVYIHTRVPEIRKVRVEVFSYFLISVGAAILVSVVLVYILSRRLSKPLKQIRDAAKVIAGGEFRKRLNIHSNDEIGELAASFNQMVVALQNLEEMRRGFIANVSHELRTPMTSVRGFVEGILDGTIPQEKHREYLMVVRDEVNRLNRLVNDLLDLAKLEAGEMKLTLRNFDINELIRRCIIKLEALITEKDISIEADFEDEEILVNADSDAIERVVINLLHNAIKFTPEKGKIHFKTERQKDRIQISIEDTGVGIDPEEIPMIWDRFYKSDKSRGRDKTGTGLGLAIVKNIINEHKQDIQVESEPGKGTRFVFTLGRANWSVEKA
jgi:signal transduction histidine kinase